jgi:hypothetical protein
LKLIAPVVTHGLAPQYFVAPTEYCTPLTVITNRPGERLPRAAKFAFTWVASAIVPFVKAYGNARATTGTRSTKANATAPVSSGFDRGKNLTATSARSAPRSRVAQNPNAGAAVTPLQIIVPQF